MMQLKQHALSAKLPRMSADALEALAHDIKANGLQHSILLYDGQVLDGWNRYEACLLVGINPRTTVFRGKDPRGIVISENIHRRHDLNAGQRAIITVEILDWAPTGKPAKGATVAPLATVAEMAEQANTGERVIQQAKVVEANGTDNLKAAVKDGTIAVHKAAKIAKLPKEKQAKAMAEPKPKKEKPAPPADAWKGKYDALVEEYNELKENRDDLADELKTCEVIRTGDAALEIKKLREHLKIVTRRRDELMANAVEMRKSLAWWQREAKKLGWKPK